MPDIEQLLADAGLDPVVLHQGPGPLCTGCLPAPLVAEAA